MDDLEAVDQLEQHVAMSQLVLVLDGAWRPSSAASSQWLQSIHRNHLQMREITAAQRYELPLLRLREAGTWQRAADAAAAAAPLDGAEPPPELERLECPTLDWHERREFQLVVFAQIAERLLLASPAYSSEAELPLYVRGALPWAQPLFDAPVPLYTSPSNPAAAAVVHELASLFPELTLVEKPTANAHWLIMLSTQCFEGANGERLAYELIAALDQGVRPLMLYDPTAAEFGEVVAAMPSSVVSASLYGPLTIEWRRGTLRAVSVRLVARALGARLGHGCCADARHALSAFVRRWSRRSRGTALLARAEAHRSGHQPTTGEEKGVQLQMHSSARSSASGGRSSRM